jgi:hypothetical protein
MKIFPVYYFPSVSWFAAALDAQTIVLEKYEFYRKQHYFNRMEIKTPEKVLRLSIPIKKAAEHTPIGERYIAHDWNWRHDHWKSIETALRSAPYFEFFESRIFALYDTPIERLYEFNIAVIKMVCEALHLDIQWTDSTAYQTEGYALDYRQSFDAKGGTMPDWFKPQSYLQVFGDVFSPDLSILDLMCNKGPETERILRASFQPAVVQD